MAPNGINALSSRKALQWEIMGKWVPENRDHTGSGYHQVYVQLRIYIGNMPSIPINLFRVGT